MISNGPNRAFISIYAALFAFAISLSGLYTLRHISIKKELALSLYFQKQSMLYALSVKDIALECLKKFGLDNCRMDKIDYDNIFYAEYIINDGKISDPNHADFGKDILLLDISVYANTPMSTHAMQYARRFILKERND